ncbi:MAG: PTS sugar transporter subunit IIA [Planctomycetota bacterium]
MALIDLIAEKIVKIPLESKDKPDVLRELVQILKDAGEIDDFNAVLKAVQDREDKQSTGLEESIAVPHCKTTAVSSLKLAIGIAPQGIDFDSVDGEPSKLFFLLLAPPGQSGPHVEALAEIARLARSKSFCKALVHADNARITIYFGMSNYTFSIQMWAYIIKFFDSDTRRAGQECYTLADIKRDKALQINEIISS